MLIWAEHEKLNNLGAMARGYKTFFIFNSTEHEISTAHKSKMLKIKDYFSCVYISSDVLIILQINVWMPTIVVF